MASSILTPVQKQILEILAKDNLFSKHFYLSGGTALSEYYLHHRFSDDLDFFSEEEIDKIWLNSLARKIKQTIGFKKLDIEESFNRNLVYFTTPAIMVKTEFTYYPFPPIEPFGVKDGIKVDSLMDITINKFFTIYQKPTARHFIDLYLILTEKNYTWDQLEKFARIKFETDIDPIQLGSQLIKSETVKDIPRMIKKLSESQWRSYFIEQAKLLKSKFAK